MASPDRLSAVTDVEQEKRPLEDLTLQVEEEEAQYPDLSVATQILLTGSLTLAMMLNITSTQAVTLALTQMQEELEISTTNLQWLTSAYSLAFGGTLLFFGRLADIFGHKLVFLAGMAWFLIWSIACGFAPGEISVDIFRAFQGAGMGAAIPAALGILGSSFPPSQAKSTAFATFSAGAPLGGSLGSVFGGILTEYAPIGWRAIFHVMAGIAAIVILGAVFLVPADRKRNKELTVDIPGAFLIVSGLTLVTFALADGSGKPRGWLTPYIAPLFTVGMLLLIAFWFWERHLEYNTDRHPLMKTSIWGRGRFTVVQIIAALGWSAFASFMYFCTLWYQDLQQLRPVQATVRFLPSPITGLFLNAIVAVLVSRIPAQYMISIGALGTAIAPLLFAVQDSADPYWQWQFPAMILSVFGADFIFATGIMYVSKVAGAGDQALGGGIFNVSTMLGTSLGLAINTIIQARVTKSKTLEAGGNSPHAALESGLRGAFWGCFGFAAGALIIAMVFLHGIGKVGERVKKSNGTEEERTIGAEVSVKG